MSQFSAVLQRFVRYLLDCLCWLLGLFSTVERSYLPPITDPLLLQSGTTLAAKIKAGKLKSETVIRAYITRIKQVQPLINAINDERFEEALAEAKALDAIIERQLAESGELDSSLLAKPFLGLPYTGKDSISIKGLRLTSGIPARKDIRAEVDSSVAKLWAEAGAIPLCQTNVPELLLWWDTFNKSFGRTSNPYAKGLIPGGSTGGNASLISSCGSLMGIASDIGGSTRMPALFCGLYGHCCSVETVPIDNNWPPYTPSRLKLVSYGPLARYVADLRPLVKMYMSKYEGESTLKLDERTEVSKLKVFYMTSFNDPALTPVCEEVQQTVRIAAKHLQSLGATVREIKKDKDELSFENGFSMWMAKMDEAEDVSKMSYEMTNRNGEANLFLELLKALVGASEHTMAAIFTALFREIKTWLPGARETKACYIEQHRRLKGQLDRLLGDDGVLLLPTHPELAVKPLSCYLKFKNTAYTGVFNTLRVAMTQIPLGLSEDSGDGRESAGLPVGLQAIASYCNDHLTLTVAELLDREFGGWVAPTKVLTR